MKSERWARIISLVGLVLLLILRYQVLIHFGWQYTDSDQAINWLTASDLAHGEIHSPFFYGQFYNNILEAFISAPFVAAGLPVQYVVPAVANIIGFIPFLCAFILFYRKQRFDLSMVVVFVAVFISTEFHLISSMARGFMGGLAFLSTGVLMNHSRRTGLRIAGYALVLSSVFVNPNVLIVLGPLTLYFILSNWRMLRSIWLELAIAVGISLVVFVGLQTFKHLHPEYEVHRLWTIDLSKDYFQAAVRHMNDRYKYILPTSGISGYLAIITLVVLSLIVMLKKRNHIDSWIALSSCVFLVLTWFVNKTCDGSDSLFFPYVRMYLGLPLLYIMLLAMILKEFKHRLILSSILLITAVISLTTKNINTISYDAFQRASARVQVVRIERVCQDCSNIEEIAKKHDAELIVFHNKADEYTYGCVALNSNLRTIHPHYDRRSWSFEQYGHEAYSRILFLDWNLNFDRQLTQHNGTLTPLKNIPFPAYLLTGNNQSLIELYQTNQLDLRPIKPKE